MSVRIVPIHVSPAMPQAPPTVCPATSRTIDTMILRDRAHATRVTTIMEVKLAWPATTHAQPVLGVAMPITA